MDEEPIEHFNSDSGDNEFQINDMSDNEGAQGAGDNDNDTGAVGWISWFCSIDGHEYMVEVEDSFVRDSFNLYGLNAKIPQDKFKQCIKLILQSKAPSEEELTDEQFLELNNEASDLYGLIHARYINTSVGLAKVYNKFLNGLYGNCPRALCDR